MLYSFLFFESPKQWLVGDYKRKYIRNGVSRKCLKNSWRFYGESWKKNPSVKKNTWGFKVEVDSLILSANLVGKLSQIYCQRKLWLYFFIWPGKENENKKQLYNLRCCKTMEFEVSGLATKNRFIHCLQRIVHYFTKEKSTYF